MIKLFRRFRKQLANKSNASRYGLYAAGEIFLVVIGILIALHLPAREATAEQAGVNNWNESKKDRLFEKKMLIEVKNAIHADQQHYLQMRDRMEELKNSANFFVDYIADGKEMQRRASS